MLDQRDLAWEAPICKAGVWDSDLRLEVLAAGRI